MMSGGAAMKDGIDVEDLLLVANKALVPWEGGLRSEEDGLGGL